MRLLVIVWLAVSLSAFAQQQQEKKCPPRETYRSLRYDEDWSGLRECEFRTDPFDELKFIPIGDQAYMSVGGEGRLRYERYTNPGFGTDPPTPSGYLLQRYLFHGAIHLTPSLRFFIQFQSGIEDGRSGGPRPSDEDIADIHQGFLGISIAHLGDSPLILRIGRQELEFGSGRMVGGAEGLNIRRSFDGLRFHYSRGKWSFNSTLLRPVTLNRGAFDAVPDHTQTLWGTGGTRRTRFGGGSLYYFGIDHNRLRLTSLIGRDLRHTMGSRWWGTPGRWDFNGEYFLQFGRFAGRPLLAGAGSFDLGWNFPKCELRPRIGIRADATSGGVSTSPKDSVHTFMPLFPNPPDSGSNAILSPANLLQISPTLRTVFGRFTLFFDSPFSWRSSTSDGIYNFADILVRPGNRTNARYVGAQPGGQLDIQMNRHWTANLQHSQTPPGKNVDYFVR
jgi:hypothetical protein